MAERKDSDGGRELIQPHEKRYQRRKDDGAFGKSDDMHRSLSADAGQHSSKSKPSNQGDRGD